MLLVYLPQSMRDRYRLARHSLGKSTGRAIRRLNEGRSGGEPLKHSAAGWRRCRVIIKEGRDSNVSGQKDIVPYRFQRTFAGSAQGRGRVCLQLDAALLLVHVVPVLPALPDDPKYVFKVPEYERLLHKDVDEKLAQLVSQKKDMTLRTIVGHGDVADEIVRIAETAKADLIVIATHGATGWRRFLFGAVAEKVVRLANSPVLTIRKPLEEPTYTAVER